MAIEFNHTIVWSKDKFAGAAFLAEILGLPEPVSFSHFQVVKTANGVNVDFANADGAVSPQHYAFLVSEAEFDAIFSRIKNKRLSWWADPMQRQEGEINHHDGGRGLYFKDPSGHMLEIITVPYGAGGS